MFKSLKKKFKKIPLEKRENKQSLKLMFEKANTSSLAGAPLSWVLNIIITVPVAVWALSLELNYVIIAAILWIPFYIASLVRQIVIDYLYAVYNINLDPVFWTKHLLKEFYKKVKRK